MLLSVRISLIPKPGTPAKQEIARLLSTAYLGDETDESEGATAARKKADDN